MSAYPEKELQRFSELYDKSKPCPRASRYRVTPCGTVLTKTGGMHGFWRPKSTKLSLGYPTVKLLLDDGRRDHPVRVHILVAEAFLGNRPPGEEVCHIDGNRQNNDISNLRWGSHRDNMRDRTRHGNDPRGERSGNARLTKRDVVVIRALLEDGWQKASIAKLFDVSPSTIFGVARGENWSWVDENGNDPGLSSMDRPALVAEVRRFRELARKWRIRMEPLVEDAGQLVPHGGHSLDVRGFRYKDALELHADMLAEEKQ